MIDTLLYADTWRLIAASLSGVTCVALVAALSVHGRELRTNHRRWFWLLVAVTGQQLVTVYLTAARAKSTPPGFPEDRVDEPLIALVLSAAALAVASCAVLVSRHRRGGSS